MTQGQEYNQHDINPTAFTWSDRELAEARQASDTLRAKPVSAEPVSFVAEVEEVEMAAIAIAKVSPLGEN